MLPLLMAHQITGFHYALLGYNSVDEFVFHLYTHEKAHLENFGLYCKTILSDI